MQPKLRPVEFQWIRQRGQLALFLHDRLALCDQGVALPAALAPLMALVDGTRDLPTLQTAFELRTGVRLPMATLEQLIAQLDEAMLLDSPRFAAAYRAALEAFRAAPYREPALADNSYPADTAALEQTLDQYFNHVAHSGPTADQDNAAWRGVVIPHIDFPRGGLVYAQVWQKARQALQEAEVVVVLGTDHNSAEPGLTLTRQNYATPWGVLPTAEEIVETIAAAVGPEAAFANELHHRREHSIELAAIWIHYLRRHVNYQLVPILCGSFQAFVDGPLEPAEAPILRLALDALRRAINGRRAFVVAAADLAHVGPAFGDPLPLGPTERAALANADGQLLDAIGNGDPQAFFRPIREERDRRRICGLPPIYVALQLLGDASGEVVSYTQCPADATAGSLVSIAGILLR